MYDIHFNKIKNIMSCNSKRFSAAEAAIRIIEMSSEEEYES